MPNDEYQEHNGNGDADNIPPEVQWHNDQIQNGGAAPHNQQQQMGQPNDGVQEVQAQNEVNQNPIGGVQGVGERINFNHW